MNRILTTLAGLLLLSACKEQPTTTPQRKDLVDAVFASGNIITKDEYRVTAMADGYLEVAKISEGDTVAKNKLLFRLNNSVQQLQVENAATNYQFAKSNADGNSPQIRELEEQISQAMRKKQTDEANLQRYENLIKTNAVSRVDYENVKLVYQNDLSTIAQLQKSLDNLKDNLQLNKANALSQYQLQQQNNQYYNLTADGGGTVLQVLKNQGDLVKRGETVAVIGSGSKIMKLFIDEDDIEKIKLNQPVYVSLNTAKGTVYEGYLSKIYPSFDNSAQSFIAEATFTKFPAVLKDGTQLQANIVVSEKQKALVIPTEYLVDDNTVLLKEGQKKKNVQTGIKSAEWVEIIGGLKEGDVIELPQKQ
ncbi:efflux RND transporter periplasmic adaptor subunit [Arundinibacter roseus]|uniref:HlyD family efflux transporter periplasmic adaptor subunit n=1 Tax=Arundinibacter roseus TaxID=2070510 RepID=A0A4R4KJT4_9BACT|nr:efflux RND transporter periplasmic adaptor subunit [Arundinibacter roseus]TDB66791.1 HlyD family efflux transporter periplasmic adaptor subunit [Arundinibacter roseus]